MVRGIMDDSQFDDSAFGDAGTNAISVFGFGSNSLYSEPLFVVDEAAGPSWHLLRDYYRLYHRMQNPMSDPTLLGQDHFPSMSDMRSEFGLPVTDEDSSYQPSFILGGGIPWEGEDDSIAGYYTNTQFLEEPGDLGLPVHQNGAPGGQ